MDDSSESNVACLERDPRDGDSERTMSKGRGILALRGEDRIGS